MTRPPLDPDELLTKARQSISKGLQLAGQGDSGPAMAWLGDAATAIENLDAYLVMGGRLPSAWKRARPAGAPSRVDQAPKRSGTACPATTTDQGRQSPPLRCTRLRGHDGPHKHLASGHAWS